MKLAKDVHAFIASLNSQQVEYVVVGGHAVAFHGYPRFTGDIDFLLRPSVDNARRVLLALADFGFSSLDITEQDLTRPGQVIQLGYPPNRIDLVTEVTGVAFDAVWAGRVSARLDGLEVQIMGREALLTNKRATGRAKDLADIAAIEDADGSGS